MNGGQTLDVVALAVSLVVLWHVRRVERSLCAIVETLINLPAEPPFAAVDVAGADGFEEPVSRPWEAFARKAAEAARTGTQRGPR